MTTANSLPQGTDSLVENLTRAKARALLDKLTEREAQVMVGLAHTKTRKEIGRDLGISETRVAQLTAAAKRKIGTNERSTAVGAFVIARQLCDQPVYTEKHLQSANQIINRIVSDRTAEEALKQLTSQEFREFLADLRTSGPKAWTAKYGPWWRLVAGVAYAVLVMAALVAALWLGPSLDILAP